MWAQLTPAPLQLLHVGRPLQGGRGLVQWSFFIDPSSGPPGGVHKPWLLAVEMCAGRGDAEPPAGALSKVRQRVSFPPCFAPLTDHASPRSLQSLLTPPSAGTLSKALAADGRRADPEGLLVRLKDVEFQRTDAANCLQVL